MKDNGPQAILHQWRVKILNIFFGVVAVISLPAIGNIIFSAVSEPKNRPMAIAFSVVELFLIALAVLRGLPIHLRIGGLWLIGYAAAILNLTRTGLSGAGPLYLLVIPILILILAGKRASFFTALFSGLLAIGFSTLIEQDLLVPSLMVGSQGTSLTTVIMLLTIVMTILILFYRLQEQLIANERRAQAELLQARVLQESQRRMANIISFLPDATLVIDHEGKVIAWNRAIEEMTGIPAAEMMGKGDHEYALPFYGERRPILIDLVLLPRAEMEQKYAQIHREGDTLSAETYTPALKGGRYLYATASALYDGEGNVIGAIEIIRDITERMHAEEELRKAKADAEQANHAKSAFLANMSHELRTPLNAIVGFTRIVRRKGENLLPEKQIENLEKVLTSAENLLSLINTVLDIAKIEAGRMDVLPATFRVGPLIDLCFNTIQPLLRPEVALQKQADETLPPIYSDQDKIRQIILNLLSNAAKFTHKGKIALRAAQNGENLTISVADTGIGIPSEALPNIFKEFEQADITTTRNYGGTGLGLTISRNLARLLGGDLTVQSEFGQGSTFTLIIPIHYERGLPALEASTAAPTSPPQPASVTESSQNPEADSVKKRILVIDDDPDAVYLLQENLARQELDILGCRNGLDALPMARQRRPQAILLDILMPGADGWQVLHDLKHDPATAEIPVILHTIFDNKALGFQLGAADYLLKPLDPQAVREALERVMPPDAGQPKHILVVDDDPNVADMLSQSLPESQFSLESAPDGLAGLGAIAARRPDILLLDLTMPNLDGFGVIERLRSNPQTRDLPVIVISAKDLTADEAAHLKESVAYVMKKQGFEGEKLLEEITRALRRQP